ncbi:MAG: thiamine pyrophosphate-binding protein, partial [Gemmatimonadetes bacterium]|nr:thiamine pyrophosphate-binding protein [Gemmatimonadota bacterium]
MNGGELVAAALEREGVRAVFTLCGGHISPILVAAKRRGIRVVDVRDEAAAIFAADAVARLTGVPGVAVVTAGPGATNSLTAITNARQAESPVIVLGGAPPTILKGRGALQDVDHQAMLVPHVKSAALVTRVRDLAPAVARAFAAARSGTPGPAFVECPTDVLYDERIVREMYGVDAPPRDRTLSDRVRHWALKRHVARLMQPGAAVDTGAQSLETPPPSPELPGRAVSRTSDLLRRARRPVLVLGSQAVRVGALIPRLIEALEHLGVPVYTNGMARGLLRPGHSLSFRHRRTAAL